jgi:hypothetical protein
VVRTTGDPAALAQSIAAAIRSVDPEQPIYDARTLDEVVDRSLAQRWLQTALLTTFASIALLLASSRVYGVIAYAVGQRQREFGIRLALGAHRSEIVGLVMRRGACCSRSVRRSASVRRSPPRAFSVVCSTTSAASIRSALVSPPQFFWRRDACLRTSGAASGGSRSIGDASNRIARSQWPLQCRDAESPGVSVCDRGNSCLRSRGQRERPTVAAAEAAAPLKRCQFRGLVQSSAIAWRRSPAFPAIQPLLRRRRVRRCLETTDGGIRWNPVSDSMPVQAIGALAVAPADPNVVWAGTGEAWAIRDSRRDRRRRLQVGRCRSHLDELGLVETGRIARILIHPTNPDIVFVCASGRLTGPQKKRACFEPPTAASTGSRCCSSTKHRLLEPVDGCRRTRGRCRRHLAG